jgi:hypothetical protein
MTKLKYILPVLILFLFSCEKVIEIDLNNANPRIVIEANIYGERSLFYVKVSETVNYFDSFSNIPISGAVITLSDNEGRSTKYHEVEDGVYESDFFMPIVSQYYKLKVEVNGQVYESSSFMNESIDIHNISWEYNKGAFFFDSGYMLSCGFSDPKNEVNYYQFRFAVNGEPLKAGNEFFVFSDEFFDGNDMEFTLRQRFFQLGDTVSVSLLTIDKPVYDYYNTLQEILGGSSASSAAPANPISDFSNGALGYFSAYSETKKIVVIEKDK